MIPQSGALNQSMSDISISEQLVAMLTSERQLTSNSCRIHVVPQRATWRDVASVLLRAADEGWWWSGAAGSSWQCWMNYKVQSSGGGPGLARRLHSSIFVLSLTPPPPTITSRFHWPTTGSPGWGSAWKLQKQQLWGARTHSLNPQDYTSVVCFHSLKTLISKPPFLHYFSCLGIDPHWCLQSLSKCQRRPGLWELMNS